MLPTMAEDRKTQKREKLIAETRTRHGIPEGVMLAVAGLTGGWVSFDGALVTISRPKHGVTRIPVRRVTTVQVQAPRGLSAGFVRFTHDGTTVTPFNDKFGYLPGSDPDAMVFTRDDAPGFEALADAVLAAAVTPTGS